MCSILLLAFACFNFHNETPNDLCLNFLLWLCLFLSEEQQKRKKLKTILFLCTQIHRTQAERKYTHTPQLLIHWFFVISHYAPQSSLMPSPSISIPHPYIILHKRPPKLTTTTTTKPALLHHLSCLSNTSSNVLVALGAVVSLTVHPFVQSSPSRNFSNSVK